MSETIEIRVPDIGDVDKVDVIEILVAVGDQVAVEDGLLTLESDKASMDVPATSAGVVAEILVKVGDQVGEGDSILRLDAADSPAAASSAETEPAEAPTDADGVEVDATEAAATETVESGTPAGDPAQNEARSKPAPTPAAADTSAAASHAEVLVLGSGPGGYTAAFRAADLGKKVILVERHEQLGGVCLNVGCIPSKALLHAARVLDEAAGFKAHGIDFGKPKIDLDQLRGWKDSVVGQLTGGIAAMAKRRGVEVVRGEGRLSGSNALTVAGEDGETTLTFDSAILAAGSRVVRIPGIPYDDPRVIDSTGALELADVPARLLIIGGGIIGLEMATVYGALGSAVTVVEMMDGLIPGCDRDLVKPLQKRLESNYGATIRLATKVAGVTADEKGLEATFESSGEAISERFDRVLVAVGRRPNGDTIAAEAAGVKVDERGFIPVDREQRTNVGHIFAIGDLVGQPMLAHKATHEGKVAAEVAAGEKSAFDARGDPLGRLHRSRGRVGRPDRNRGQGQRHPVRAGSLPLVGERPLSRRRPQRRLDQVALRPRDQAHPGRRHRRPQRRRVDRRARARHRDGLRGSRYRADSPPPPDTLGDRRLRRRGLRGHDHRSLHSEATCEEVNDAFRLDDALDLLARTPAILSTQLADLPERWTLADEGPETFSPFEVVGHLIHGERTDWIPRLRLILECGPDVTFEPYDRFAQRAASRDQRLAELLETFGRLRAENLDTLRALELSATDLERRGSHPELGPVTARQLLATWVVHDLSHLSQVNRVMAGRYRDAVGPWTEYLRILGG